MGAALPIIVIVSIIAAVIVLATRLVSPAERLLAEVERLETQIRSRLEKGWTVDRVLERFPNVSREHVLHVLSTIAAAPDEGSGTGLDKAS